LEEGYLRTLSSLPAKRKGRKKKKTCEEKRERAHNRRFLIFMTIGGKKKAREGPFLVTTSLRRKGRNSFRTKPCAFQTGGKSVSSLIRKEAARGERDGDDHSH